MLKERVGTALVLSILFLAALFYLSDFQWSLLMLAVVAMGAWEWGALTRLGTAATRAFVGVLLGMGGLWLWLVDMHAETAGALTMPWQATVLITLFWAALVPLWLRNGYRAQQPWLLALVGLMVLFPTWLAFDGLHRASPLLLLGVMMTVWIADTAAYFAGRRFGRRKLAPSISPGKTWEGVIGAVVGVALYGLALCALSGISLWLALGMLALTAFSIIGDLFESMLKRQAGLKDSGSLLPGHGGVLDRIDGLTSTLPLAYFFLPFYVTMLGQA